MNKLKTIILAAGEGKRMNSEIPKVLHKVLDKPMINYVLDVAKEVGSKENMIIVGHKGQNVMDALTNQAVFATQDEQLGTAHAVRMAGDFIDDSSQILVLYGDTPLITKDTLTKMIKEHEDNKASLTLVSAILEDSTGYGRVVRENDKITSIVEHKDADPNQLKIKEVNTGIYLFDSKTLKYCLENIQNNNAQNEFYLTDAIEIVLKKGLIVSAFVASDFSEFLGVNSRNQLAEATVVLKNRVNNIHMDNGVTFIDPNTNYISSDTKIGKDTIIYPNVIIEGKTEIGKNCFIGSNTKIINSIIADNVNIESSFVLDSKIGSNSKIGPFAYLRPNSFIGEDCKIGDFVEVKNSTLGNNTKASHLTYIGDSEIGNNINFGCGSITVNYDGANKYKTIVEDNCFIGCNTNLVAPVKVEKNSYIAAGSTITEDVPEKSLAIARSKQIIKKNWKKKQK